MSPWLRGSAFPPGLRWAIAAAVAMAGLGLFVACPAPPGGVDPRAAIVATVREASTDALVFTLKRGEVEEAIERARLETDRAAEPLAPEARRALVEQMIEDRLLAWRAAAAGVEASTTAVAAELSALEAELGAEVTASALARVYRSEAELAAAIRARLTAERLIESHIPTSTPTEARIRAAYDRLGPEQRRRADRVHASQIVLETEGDAFEVKKALAEGADFAELARARSIAPEGPEGGDLGWFEAGTMPPVFDEICFGLEPGETSAVVPSTYGYHVFFVHAREPAHAATYAELRSELARQLLDDDRAEAERAFRASLTDGLTVTLHPEVLQSLGAAPDTAAEIDR